MIDLHCHVLPGIDDGARSLDLAVEMCRLAAARGCETLVATPHQRRGAWWNCDRAALAALRRQLQEAVGPSPRILGGGEIHVDRSLLGEILAHCRRDGAAASAPEVSGGETSEAPEAPKAPATQESPENPEIASGEEDVEGPLPLAGSRYLLLEFGAGTAAPDAAELVHELSVGGWCPVLAHPELITWMVEDVAVIAHLVALGALAQVTAMSVTGDFGRRAQADCLRLIDLGLVHFVASDAHDLKRRPPGLEAAWKRIARTWGEAAARRLLVDNPGAVIADRPLADTLGGDARGAGARAGYAHAGGARGDDDHAGDGPRDGAAAEPEAAARFGTR
jgi:protein-tyrosine phosphatase